MGFPGGSAGKDACNVGNLGLIPVLGKSPGKWNTYFHGLYSPWGRKESDTTERLTFFSFLSYSEI